MSWLRDLATPPTEGGETPPASPFGNFPINDTYPKVADPAIPQRMVSTKAANRPFLAHKEWRDRQQAEHDAWAIRDKERDEKLARGEKVGPKEADPTAEEEVGVLGLLKFFLYLTVFVLLAGKFFTGSYTWEYEGKWVQLKTYMPTGQRLFTEDGLAEYDGTKPNKLIFIGIDGDVYDVSSNPGTYGPGGSYHSMAGVDAARSFATGCFKTHRTHDLRGLSDSELQGIKHWKDFFANHKDYSKVGRVLHHPIDPASPIPEHCNPKASDSGDVKKSTVENAAHVPDAKPAQKAKTDRTEL